MFPTTPTVQAKLPQSTSPFSSSSTVTTVLPFLIALRYHEVKINFTFAKLADLCHYAGEGATPALPSVNEPPMSLYIDYVYLDTDERKRFAQSQHELLIEQLQFTGDETPMANGSYRLNFNHPVKELVWVVTQPLTKKSNKFNYAAFDTSGEVVEPVTSANLQLNGHDRFDAREGSYFRLVQPSNTTLVFLESTSTCTPSPSSPKSINLPVHHFSRIDNATLKLQLSDDVDKEGKVKIFATSVNVLRILGGMGGLAYSN